MESLRHDVLGLKTLFGAPSGQNQVNLIWSTIFGYQIEKTLRYFTLNNATNNCTVLHSIQNQINHHKPLY